MSVEDDGIRNVRQVLWRSVDSLATNTGVIQDRLLSSALFLTGPLLGLESLSPEKGRELEAIIQDFRKEGTIEATLRMISDDDAVKLATRIVSLYINLRGGI